MFESDLYSFKGSWGKSNQRALTKTKHQMTNCGFCFGPPYIFLKCIFH